MVVIGALRSKFPDIVMDHRVSVHSYGPWYVAPYAHVERACALTKNPEAMHVCRFLISIRSFILALPSVGFSVPGESSFPDGPELNAVYLNCLPCLGQVPACRLLCRAAVARREPGNVLNRVAIHPHGPRRRRHDALRQLLVRAPKGQQKAPNIVILFVGHLLLQHPAQSQLRNY